MRNKILKIMNENNYYPSVSAQNVAGYSNRLIALIIPISLKYFLANPHYSRMLNELICNLDKRGYYLLLTSYSEDKYMEMVKRSRVDGFIVLSSQFSQNKILEELHRGGVPCVATSGLRPSFVPSVDVDNLVGGRLVTEYLLHMGHRRIAYVYDRAFASYCERQKGYEEALEEAGIPVVREYIISIESADSESGYAALNRLMQLPVMPTAVFACNDQVAKGIYAACAEKNISIPEELSVVGYDNDADAAQLVPPLTSVDQKLEKRCERVVELLIDYIDNKIQPHSEIWETELVERASVAKIL